MEGFSPHLISVIALAEEEAQTSGSIYVAPEHLLLGLLRFRDEAASELLRKSGLDVEKLSGSIPKIAPMTRKNDFASVWDEIEQLLEEHPRTSALKLLRELQERHPGEFAESHRRTLQTRMKEWLQKRYPLRPNGRINFDAE